jgi:hypothetical protein
VFRNRLFSILQNRLFNDRSIGFTGVFTPPTHRLVILAPLIYTHCFKTRDTGVKMWGGSFSGKGFGTGRENGGRKGPPIVWEGSFGLDSYLEAVYEFPV